MDLYIVVPREQFGIFLVQHNLQVMRIEERDTIVLLT